MRFVKITGHLFFLIYGLLALIFYKERIILADSAFQLFKIIHFGTFNIEAERYSTVLVQLLPLLIIKLSLPLKTVMMAFSLSYVFIYYLIFLLCVYVFKNDSAAILIPLVLLVGIRQSFFHTVTETHQGMVYSVLFFAWYNYQYRIRNDNYETIYLHSAVSFFFILLCYFAHPVTFFTVLFVVIWRIAEKQEWKKKEHYTILLFIGLLYFLKTFITDRNSYEGILFSHLGVSGFKQSFLPAIRFLLGNSYKIYPFLFIIFCITFIRLIREKNFLCAGVYVLFLGIFKLVAILTFSISDSVFMMEKNFMPVVFIGALPFAQMIEETEWKQNKNLLIALCALVYSFGWIAFQGMHFGKRLNQFSEIMKQHPEKKLIMSSASFHNIPGLVPWSVSFETLLLSSLDGPEHSKTIFIQNDPIPEKTNLNDKNLFLGAPFWLEWDTQTFNRNYFDLKEKEYQKLN